MNTERTVATLEEQGLEALQEFIAAVRTGENRGKEVVSILAWNGLYLHAVLTLSVTCGISVPTLAKLIDRPEKQVRMWLRSANATPRDEGLTKFIISKIEDEICRRWTEKTCKEREAKRPVETA